MCQTAPASPEGRDSLAAIDSRLADRSAMCLPFHHKSRVREIYHHLRGLLPFVVAMDAHATTTDLDVRLDALADPERRRVLRELGDCSPEADLDVLADGGRTNDHDSHVAMSHVHLPKLAGEGFVDWDRGADTVTRGANFDEIEPLLDLLDVRRQRLDSVGDRL